MRLRAEGSLSCLKRSQFLYFGAGEAVFCGDGLSVTRVLEGSQVCALESEALSLFDIFIEEFLKYNRK